MQKIRHGGENWNKGTSDDSSDDLDIDHGSVTDLWHAVATRSEKLAEIMPGMLLVVGLLGTFLGLGLALNSASNILGQSSTLTASGAANNMQDLMNMMQGLGTKFKTSTWGITFFLLLKAWSSWTGFEEKRLAWVIRKVKTELEHRKVQEQETEINKQQALFTQINQAAEKITQGFTQNLEKFSEFQQTRHQQTLQYFGKFIQTIRGDLSKINTTIQSDNAAIKQVLEQSTQGVREDLEKINRETQISSNAMVDFSVSTKAIIKDISTASNMMADGAHKVGSAGSSLVKAVEDFSDQFSQVLGDVRTDLSTAINNMSTQAAQTLEQGSKELGKATLEISTALGVLSKDVTTTMNGVKNSIEKSLKIQESGAILFRNSSDTLNENITTTTELNQTLGEKIRSSLEAVSESGRRMVSIGKSLDTVISQMRDLPTALEPLNTKDQPLLDETKVLRANLLEINHRQEHQFEQLLKTQHDLTKNIQASYDTLNDNITAMTASTNKLNRDIFNNPQRPSDSDRKTIQIDI